MSVTRFESTPVTASPWADDDSEGFEEEPLPAGAGYILLGVVAFVLGCAGFGAYFVVR